MADASRSTNDIHANRHWQLIPEDEHFPVLDLPPGRSLLLGRDPSADLVLSHPKVSRQHAALVVKENCIEVRDLGSRNGVSINGKWVSEGSVYPGDELCFEQIGFHVSSPFGKTEIMEAVSQKSVQETLVMTPCFALLEGVSSQYAGKTFALAGTELITGRSEHCDIVLDHRSISHRHARLYQQGREWFISDIGSTNGTLVNGESADETRLQDGDNISFAGILLQYKSLDSKALDSLATNGSDLESELLQSLEPGDQYMYQYRAQQKRRSQPRSTALSGSEPDTRFAKLPKADSPVLARGNKRKSVAPVVEQQVEQQVDGDRRSESGLVFGAGFGPEPGSESNPRESAISRQLEQERKGGPSRPQLAEPAEQAFDYTAYLKLAVYVSGAFLVLLLLVIVF